jgi:predicted TIM-barrel fold metal-dependent hydrolase
MMWSTDFPHVVTRWPKSLQALESQMAGVPQAERWNMVAGNAIKFFRLDHTPDRKESKL